MNINERKNLAYVITIIAGFCFSVWQMSLPAGIFAACITWLLSSLVVVVQEGFEKLTNLVNERDINESGDKCGDYCSGEDRR
jgi:hypothetical protein